jgi:hypothetical protein
LEFWCDKNKAEHSADAETYALELVAGTLITGFKNIVPKRPDFIQKIAWLPATG